ncbi:hypothetical protein [Bradyrhizobium erythrophlei]|uniref:Uncharacterized protein n=1 Tax=Bradyrhizobium erythrophlei TaxID=1437360 RepID=A0A1H5GCZ1_9BRAD|nr:hypothetical protein [Bradyrhizobium erythrophlei]SEE13582.1 hypothetical protein SAMN05444164_7040 [Bradyrhizobium erythrophlei]
MTKLKMLSAGLVAVAMLATPAMAREAHVTYPRHAVEADSAAAQAPIIVDGRACIPAPRVGSFATAPWTGNNVPCEPGTGEF